MCGISIELQEEERERTDISALEQHIIEVDSKTKDMLEMMDLL